MTVDQTDKALGIALARVSTLDEKKIIDDTEHYERGGHDEYLPNSEGVTKHEFDTLRHVADKLPISSFLVAFVEFAERLVIVHNPHLVF